MKRYRTILLLLLVIGMIQAACNMPTGPGTSGFPTFQVTPDLSQATAAPGLSTITPTGIVPGTGQSDANCTYAFSFVDDVTIPDDTVLRPGEAFTKTWRIKNEGTCTWGPNHNARALAFTTGDKLGAPDLAPLTAEVKPGQTADVSVNMVAPTAPGTYTSQWKLRVDNDPNGAGPLIGLGDKKEDPLYVRIKVGS